MGWNQWMVPELTAEAEFHLQARARLEVREALNSRPQAVEDLTISLAVQNAMMESIIRKATKRIAELEAREAVRQGEATDWHKVARRWVPASTRRQISAQISARNSPP
jgi:hypothetical protein